MEQMPMLTDQLEQLSVQPPPAQGRPFASARSSPFLQRAKALWDSDKERTLKALSLSSPITTMVAINGSDQDVQVPNGFVALYMERVLLPSGPAMFGRESDADLIMVAGKKSYFVHRSLLSARSPFFWDRIDYMKAQDAWRLAETQSPDSDAESMDGSEPEFDVEDDFGFEHADMNDNDPVSETESMGEHGDYLESDEEWDGQNNVEENDGGETLGAQIESDPQQALLIQDSDGPIHQNPSKANTSGSQNAMIESNHRAADGTWAISDEYESTTNRIACGMTSGSASGSASGSFGGTTSELSTFAEPQFQVNMQSDLEPMRFHKDKQLLIREKMDLDHVPDAHLQLQQQQYQQSQQQNQQQQLLPRQYAMSGTGNNQPSKRSGFGRRSLPKLKLILDNDQETCFNELLRWIYTDDGPRWLATFTEDNYKAIIKTVSQLRLFKISVLALLLEFESRTDPSKGLQGLAEEIFFRVKWRNA